MSFHHSMHIPKPPPDWVYPYFARWTIDTEAGRVFNAKGRELGSIDTSERSGYVYIATYSRHWKRANIIWWKVHGRWPILALDHLDRNKLNDSIRNLAERTHKENMRNNGCLYNPDGELNGGSI